MTLLDAKPYDQAKARKRKQRIILALVLIVIALGVGWWFRYWPEQRVVGHFFEALQKQDYRTAYGIWMHDPEWQQHPDRHPNYAFGDFYRDWGPGGKWGIIKTYRVDRASPCPGGGGSGVVVDVVVNDRVERAHVWVEKSDHTLSYPPCELMFP